MSAGERIELKIVFCGPALSGKTTNLMRLHTLLSPQRRGELMVLDTRDDRTLFFDLFPVGLRTENGLDLRVKLYTVPGQVQHDSTRKAVLSRADGVIFVADSQVSQQENNAIAFDNLAVNLERVGLGIESVPMVIQFNKRDMASILPEEEVAARWGATPWAPVVMASALHGRGVVETYRLVLERLYPQLVGEYAVDSRFGLAMSDFVRLLGVNGEVGHAAI